MNKPKYSIPEIERRWTVRVAELPDLETRPQITIRDKYLTGSRLRLRVMRGEAGVQYKLGKKYGDRNGYSESITNIYLSPEEYEILNQASGREISKTRYRLAEGSIDIYPGDGGLILYSVEFASEADARRFEPPAFAEKEVSQDERYSGFALAAGMKAQGVE